MAIFNSYQYLSNTHNVEWRPKGCNHIRYSGMDEGFSRYILSCLYSGIYQICKLHITKNTVETLQTHNCKLKWILHMQGMKNVVATILSCKLALEDLTSY